MGTSQSIGRKAVIPSIITKSWLLEDRPAALQISDELLDDLRSFCLDMWRERALERNLPAPDDLSSSCKFTSLFVRELIGGRIAGNEMHQFVIVEDEVVDINRLSKDVLSLEDPHHEDFSFIGNPEHMESLESCAFRVNQWIEHWHLLNTPGQDRKLAIL